MAATSPVSPTPERTTGPRPGLVGLVGLVGLHLAVATAAVVAALVFADRPTLIGLGAGFVLGALNLSALHALVGRLVTAGGPVMAPAAGLFAKMLLLLAAIGWVLWRLQPDPVAFLAALSAGPALLFAQALFGGRAVEARG
jgi:hypothetical protein